MEERWTRTLRHSAQKLGGGRLTKRQIILLAVLLVAALLSATVVRGCVASVDAHSATIRVLNEKQENATGLLAASAGTAAVISAIPGGMGSSIADKLMDLSGYFLFMLAVLFLEKYLLAILGTLVFGFMIPAACVLCALRMLRPQLPLEGAWSRLVRATAMGLVLFLTIPIGAWMSGVIDQTYQQTLQATIDSSNEIAAAADEEKVGDAEGGEEAQGFWSRVGGAVSGAWNSVVGGVTSALDWAKTTLNRFIEAIAVMLVTTCLIPLLPVAAGIVLAKKLYGVDLTGGRFARLTAEKSEPAEPIPDAQVDIVIHNDDEPENEEQRGA